MGIKALTFNQAIQWNRMVVWVQFREMDGGAIPMTYNMEHAPFVRFVGLDGRTHAEVRKEYYGKTWRCFEDNPAGRFLPEWDDGAPGGAWAKEPEDAAE